VSDTFSFDVDASTWARWDAEADRRGVSVHTLIREAVDAAIERRGWDGEERRRDRQSLLDATRTDQEEHLPSA
jgi:Tfp pilus assembly protein PilV